MRREKVMWRLLVGTAAFAWLGAGHFVWAVIHYDTRAQIAWLLVCLTMAGALTGAAVIIRCIKRLADAAYRLGHENGRRSMDCSMYRPVLRVVNGSSPAEVVQLRGDN